APTAPAKSYIHCTASSESAGTTRSSSSTVADSGQNNLDTTPGPRGTSRSPDGHGSKADTFSGRNSMSSLPTHSTSGSVSTATGPAATGPATAAPVFPRGSHGSVSGANQGPQQQQQQQQQQQPNFPPWSCGVNGGNANANPNPSPPRYRAGEKDEGGASLSSPGTQTDGDSGPRSLADGPGALLAETGGGGSRSPISTDELLIERLEHRLLERESELQDLQVSFEEKEVSTCQLFEERQRYCVTEMEGLKQRCSTKLRQVSQRAARNHQALQLQVAQLQAEKESLQEDISRLTQEKDLAEVRLRSYETTNTQLAPTLEDIQWEICQKSGEISLLKRQLKDCQADVNHKLNEIVSLKSTLKESRTKIDALEEQSQEDQERIRTRTVEVEVCQNELHRKKNEADLLREKVGRLETDIQAMKQDLASAKEQRHQQCLQLAARAQNLINKTAPGSPSQERVAEGSGGGGGGRGGGGGPGGPLGSTDSLRGEVERLQRQLREEVVCREALASGFERERRTWNKEKERVIRYQKQLQYNYMQMHKKNLDLERILKELTAELEGRAELDGVDGPYGCPGLQTYDDVIATEI
ncbi:hypothetical protein CRUP_007283, partial [Coryphaenoides rupestris]